MPASPPRTESAARFSRIPSLRKCYSHTWVKRPLVLALFFHNYSTFLAERGLFLEDLFVVPEARGKGVGRALFSALAEIAVARNCGRMEWSVLKWNQLAIDFYLRVGAEPLNDWATYRLTR